MYMDLNIFEKLKEIYNGIRKAAWALVPVAGVFFFVKWLFLTWLPARLKQTMEWVQGFLPDTDIDAAAVGVAWDRINQWVPANEILQYGGMFIVLAGMITMLKWLKRLIFA